MGKRSNGANSWATELIVKARDRAIESGQSPDGELIGQRIARTILRLHRLRGHQLARFAIEIAVQSWCVQLAGRVCRQDKVEAAIGWNGNVVRQKISERVSFQKRDASGAAIPGAGQYRLWVDVPRDEYFEKVAIEEHGFDSKGRNLAVLRRGERLLRQYPDAASVREACRLSGQDVRDFLLDEAAI